MLKIFIKQLNQGTLYSSIIKKLFSSKSRMKAARRKHKKLFYAYEISAKNHYEPLKIGKQLYPAKREWEERWNLIKNEIQSYQVNSIIDIGCAEGWFLRKAAEEMGCFALGIEIDDKRLLPGEIARLYDGTKNLAIMKAKVTPSDIEKLPNCDMILCLSVLHHIIYKYNIDSARLFIKAIANKVEKAVILELGTSEEKEMNWAKKMPEMPQGQSAYMIDFLSSSGLTNIREIGSTPSYKKDAKRLLFAAEPIKHDK